MSTIEKMSIQGIRSFGPDDGDKQIINFFQPLTLILGPNGTGKTTIIECLKYITTGVLPPGSKGGAFIHDPKIAHEREVKGQVRLQFSDVSGKQCIVQRSTVATQKAKKIETRTLDGVITRRNAAGEKQSINSKCADLDKEMITYLGVAKPVLENVIFCHQEDSNWPLSEGKTLKEKFDAIFASTRYVKALENIRKLKQDQIMPSGLTAIPKNKNKLLIKIDEKNLTKHPCIKRFQDGTLKLHKQDLQYLKLHKDKAGQLEENLKELEGRLAASMQSVEDIKTKLDPIEEKLDQIAKRSNEIYKVQTEITKLQSEKKQIDKNAKEIQESIENEFQGSDEALRRELAEFQDRVRERNETLIEYEGRQAELSQQLNKYNKEKSALLVEVGRLEREAEGHAENIEKRDSFIRQYAEEYKFEGFEKSDITDEKYKSFLENIRSKLDALINDTKSLKADYERKEDDLQKKMDELRDTKTKLEQNEKIKRDMVNENQMKIRLINQKLSEVEASAGKLDQLKRELKREEHELQTVESSVSVDVLKEEISELTKGKGKLDSKISELSSEMNVLHLQSSAQAQLDVLKKDRSSKEENIRRLKAKHEDTIAYLLGHMPSRNIRGELDAYVSKQSEDVRKSNASLNENRNLLSKREAERKMLADQLKKKEDEFKALEERILQVCGSQNYNEGLQNIQQKMTQSQDQRGSLLGAEHFFKKYATDLGKDDPCCPLCHREFDTEQEVRELILELQEKLRMVPAKLQKAEKDLEEFQKRYDDMMQLKPLKENMMTLETQEIPQLKAILKKTIDEIDQLKTKIQDIEDVLEVKENDEATAKLIQNDIIMMDRYQGEVQELDKKIAAQSSRLAGGDSGRTLQEVITEKEDLQIKVDSIGRQLDHKRQKLSDHMDQVQKLRTSINSMREEKLGIENDLQQRIKLEEDKANLLSENEAHNQEIKEASSRIRPLQEKNETLRHEKEILTKEKEEKIEKAKAEVDQVKNNATKVKNVNQDIKSYNQSGKADTLEHSRARTNQIQKKLEKIDMDQKEVTSNIDKLRKDLSSQKVRELDLQNNLSLRNKNREIEKMNAQILDLNAQLGGLDVSNLERERRKLQKQLDDLTKERHVAEGRQRGFEEQIKAAKKELQSDMYTGAAEKYRNKMIEFRTTEMANGDLQKYYRALDTAIMNYHNLKMAEINKIIRDLWRNTYRGNDIETIEIRSDEDDSVSMKTRRTYNYRVVMIKGDTALDMRGRCSAGQKVLASLIIRLALAETFCLNCGILALDEPTTNLDRENIESLAHALVDIIKGRSHQRNFQLMIITHDEDFVELLGRSDYVEEFYKVCKNQDGCSQLIRSKVSDLHR